MADQKECTVKWERPNSVILDCGGEVKGIERPPRTQSSGRVTIQRTDKEGGVRGAVTRALDDLGGLRKYITPTDRVVARTRLLRTVRRPQGRGQRSLPLRRRGRAGAGRGEARGAHSD